MRATTWQAASFLRKHCGRPYRFWRKFYILLVGEDSILPLFIKISLRLARDAEDVVPYNNKDSTNKQSKILTNRGNTKKILAFGKYTQTY